MKQNIIFQLAFFSIVLSYGFQNRLHTPERSIFGKQHLVAGQGTAQAVTKSEKTSDVIESKKRVLAKKPHTVIKNKKKISLLNKVGRFIGRCKSRMSRRISKSRTYWRRFYRRYALLIWFAAISCVGAGAYHYRNEIASLVAFYVDAYKKVDDVRKEDQDTKTDVGLSLVKPLESDIQGDRNGQITENPKKSEESIVLNDKSNSDNSVNHDLVVSPVDARPLDAATGDIALPFKKIRDLNEIDKSIKLNENVQKVLSGYEKAELNLQKLYKTCNDLKRISDLGDGDFQKYEAWDAAQMQFTKERNNYISCLENARKPIAQLCNGNIDKAVIASVKETGLVKNFNHAQLTDLLKSERLDTLKRNAMTNDSINSKVRLDIKDTVSDTWVIEIQQKIKQDYTCLNSVLIGLINRLKALE